MTRCSLIAVGAMMLSGSTPVLAQSVPAPGTTAAPHVPGAHNPMFAGMSDAGRAAMLEAMHSFDKPVGKAEIAAARDRILMVLDAERLDPVALRRAMDDERAAVALQQAQQAKKRAAMLNGFEQLSLADRRAFVADARAIRDRVEARAAAQQQARNALQPGLISR